MEVYGKKRMEAVVYDTCTIQCEVVKKEKNCVYIKNAKFKEWIKDGK